MANCNLRMILKNEADNATLSAVPALEATLPVTNLQLQEGANVARSTGTAVQSIHFDFTDTRIAAGDMFVLLGGFSNEAIVSLTLYSAAAQTGNIVFQVSAQVWKPIPWEEFSPWGEYQWGGGEIYDIAGAEPGFIQVPGDTITTLDTYLSGTFQITDPNNVAGYHNLSRLMIGRVLSPQIDLAPGYKLEMIDPSEMERDEGGGVVTFAQEEYRKLSFKIQHLTSVEFPAFWGGITAARKVNDIFIDLKPSQLGVQRVALQMRGKFTVLPSMSEWTSSWFESEFNIEEVK